MGQGFESGGAVCRYPGAFLDSRGPMRSLAKRYVAVFDSTPSVEGELDVPLAVGLERRTGMTCVDLSAAHAGPDALLADTGLMRIGQGATAVVLTVPGAHLLTNPYYRVHRWRNDRVIAQEDGLRQLFPEMQFEHHHYVRHMLSDLHGVSAGRFAILRQMLQRTWLQRMSDLLHTLKVPVILLWMGERRPDEDCETVEDGDPPFVTKEMAGALAVAARVEVIYRPRPFKGLRGSQATRRMLRRVPGQDAHTEAAEIVANVLSTLKLPQEDARRRSA